MGLFLSNVTLTRDNKIVKLKTIVQTRASRYHFQNLVQPDSTNQLTISCVYFVGREVSVLLPALLPVQNVKLEIKLTQPKLIVVSYGAIFVKSNSDTLY